MSAKTPDVTRLFEDVEKLQREKAEILTAIRAFCEGTEWAVQSWKEQPHIAPLFKLAKRGNRCQKES